MAQQLIVEGKDGFVIAHLCQKRNIGLPKGYERKGKIKDFIINAEGITNVDKAINEALDRSDISNLGTYC